MRGVDVSSVVVTQHAYSRWCQRGFNGNDGLMEELGQAIPLHYANVKHYRELREYLSHLNRFTEKHEGVDYFFTGLFIFILSGNNLITCISRDSVLCYPKSAFKDDFRAVRMLKYRGDFRRYRQAIRKAKRS